MRDSNPPPAPPLSYECTPGHHLVDWRTDTLLDLLQRRAAELPEKILYTFLEDGESRERILTAGELDAAARRVAQPLSKLAQPGERVVLLFDDGVDYIVGLFACLTAGLVAVSGVHPGAPRSAERLLGIVHDCAATLVLGHARVLSEFQRILDAEDHAADLRWLPIDRARTAADARAPAPVRQCATNDGLALIQYTSGSSREPRGVMLSHRNVLHNLMGQTLAFGYEHGDTGVSWLPFSHDMGLIGCVLMAVYGGGRCVLLAPSHFLEDPSRWLRAISRYRATLSGGPSFAYEMCVQRAASIDLSTLDLSSWAVAVNGAEPIRADVLRQFARTFARAGFDERAFRPSYGLAEATLMVTSGTRLTPHTIRAFERAGLRSNHAVAVARLGNEEVPGTQAQSGAEAAPQIKTPSIELVGCGQSMSDQSLVVVDPRTASPVSAGSIGEIWVAGPSIAAGYFGRETDNAEYFRGDLGDGHGPYLKTGDLGFLCDGELYVTGRSRDLIIIRGKNYYPQDLELSAEASHAAIRPGHCASFVREDGGELVVVCELIRARHEEAAAAASAVRAAVVRDHGVTVRRVVLVAWGSILKTPSGKLQRAQTRAALEEGALAVVHESNAAGSSGAPMAPLTAATADRAHIMRWFFAHAHEVGIDSSTIDADTPLKDIGFDSVKIIELKAQLAQDLGIPIDLAQLYALPDIQSLADLVLAKIERQRAANAQPPVEFRPLATASPPPNRLAEQRQRRAAAQRAAGETSSR